MIVLVDTSILDNLVPVPDWDQQRDQVLARFGTFIDEDARFLLPLVTLLETGRHIAQLHDGGQRRATAVRFCDQARQAISGQTPFTVTPLPQREQLAAWLDRFPDQATRGISLTDLTIVEEWERQCRYHPGRRVLIWSLDGDLAGYDRRP